MTSHQPSGEETGNVVALCGGVGGAKLALGLYRVLAPDRLTVIVNTGDDFEPLGLHVSPDLDTVMYTLAGIANPETGWGRTDETWSFMQALAALGGETWFRLGDRDLATHVERTRRLAAGDSLTAITDEFRRRLGIRARLLPMSDDPVRTVVHSAQGPLPFQHYFVKLACAPAVTGFEFDGAATARPNPVLHDAIADPRLRAIVICPSNPYVSVDPMLAVPGIFEALDASAAPIIAVSPIVGGRAIKGPAAKMMAELGVTPTPAWVAEHYRALLDGFVLDRIDADMIGRPPVPCQAAPTVMTSLADREVLAREVLRFADRLRRHDQAA
ncbi:MAG: 2-phospho-L-lactate transferase [Proteobacteria bacterium]|nr:2-phospho-L-lactate transferase [Pseudomonadota bacterium]